MLKVLTSIAIVATFLLSGCSTTATIKSDVQLAASDKVQLSLITPPTMSEEGAAILRARLTTQLASRGLLATGAGVKTVEVQVTNYYMRHGAARALAGIFAGVDNVKSTVRVKDNATGRVVSEFTVESDNASAWGTSRGMIEDHADKVVDSLQGKGR